MTRSLRDISQGRIGSLERVLNENKSGILGAAAPPGYDGRLTYYILSNKAHDVEGLPNWLVANIVNLRPVNDIRDLNGFFNAINAKLPRDGVFVGCIQTQGQVKARLFEKLPWLIAAIAFWGIFIYKRVFPQVVFLRKIYHLCSRGRNQMLPKGEVFGRLVYAGYDIVEFRQIDELSYFFAMKKEPPFIQQAPSAGPLLKLRYVVKGARTTNIYKFRTTYPYAEFLNQRVYDNFGGKYDERQRDFGSSFWGRLWRTLWIDRIPMLYNVIKGDLKVFGVELLGAQELGAYPAEVIERRLRYKPGLISPWYVDKPETFNELIASEERYLNAYERRPLITDLLYLLNAIKAMLFRRYLRKPDVKPDLEGSL